MARTFRNSKWTAVSDVGATEVRKYFSTFVTRPVYWFRQIVVERGSEIRDARRRAGGGGRAAVGKGDADVRVYRLWPSEIDAMMGCRDFGRGSRKLWPDEYGLARQRRRRKERRGWMEEGWRMRCTNQGEPVALGIHLEESGREYRKRYFSPRVAVIIWPSCARVTSFLGPSHDLM